MATRPLRSLFTTRERETLTIHVLGSIARSSWFMVFGFWSLRIIASPHFGKLVFVYALQNRAENHDNYDSGVLEQLFVNNEVQATPIQATHNRRPVWNSRDGDREEAQPGLSPPPRSGARAKKHRTPPPGPPPPRSPAPPGQPRRPRHPPPTPPPTDPTQEEKSSKKKTPILLP